MKTVESGRNVFKGPAPDRRELWEEGRIRDRAKGLRKVFGVMAVRRVPGRCR